MKTKVIAIYSIQEYGSNFLDFISIETGQIIMSVSMDGLIHFPKEVKIEKPTGEMITESCMCNKKYKGIQQFQIGYETTPVCISLYKYEKKVLRDIKFEDDDMFPNMYNVTKIYEKVNIEKDYPYIKEDDIFGQYLESIGIFIEYNSSERQNSEIISKLIAEKFNFEVINFLKY